MSFYEKLLALSGLAAIIGVFALGRRTGGGGSHGAIGVAVCLAIVAVALVTVGVVSETLGRHLLQIAPLAFALILYGWRPKAAVAAAAPLFAFWLLTMGAVWLLLLGVARIFSGTFTTAEIVLTIVIGAASALGLASIRKNGAVMPFRSRMVMALAFACLQFVAMWLSTQPFAAGK